jgi:valyl-tRNA synthetase
VPLAWPGSERSDSSRLGCIRVDESKLSVGPMAAYEGKKAVRLIIEDGLEAYLPLADLVDFAKEKERLTKQAGKLQAEIEVRHTTRVAVTVPSTAFVHEDYASLFLSENLASTSFSRKGLGQSVV